jgi:hypothetical protein
MNKVLNRLFENSLSLYDLVSLYIIGMLAGAVSLWAMLLIIPNMWFSVTMQRKADAK